MADDSTRQEHNSPFSPLTIGLFHAAGIVESHLEGVLSEAGLSIPKLTVLHHLVQNGEPMSLSHLAERCSCVRSNMTQLIDRLEAEGLVRRSQDARDRRSIQASITERGQELYHSGARSMREAEAAILGQWTAEQRELLHELLHRCSLEAASGR